MSLAITPDPPASLPEPGLPDLDAAFARFLRLDVANRDASPDTVRGYLSQLAAWVGWCVEHAVNVRTATVGEIKSYREDLVAHGPRPNTIAHKLNMLLHVYAAAVAASLRADNPAIGTRAPRDRRAPEDFGYLSEVELELLFRAVPRDDGLKHLRDRALLGLLGVQALRTVEITRVNVPDRAAAPWRQLGPAGDAAAHRRGGLTLAGQTRRYGTATLRFMTRMLGLGRLAVVGPGTDRRLAYGNVSPVMPSWSASSRWRSLAGPPAAMKKSCASSWVRKSPRAVGTERVEATRARWRG